MTKEEVFKAVVEERGEDDKELTVGTIYAAMDKYAFEENKRILEILKGVFNSYKQVLEKYSDLVVEKFDKDHPEFKAQQD